ncbi:MAG: Re/Si-specific NAD(P)(+) transhydrogenase subunit alpha [Alphaproteobacteria bacterium]
MGIKIAIPKESAHHERRVAASPDTVKKLTQLGCEVTIQSQAGEYASFTDNAFQDAGAKVVKSFADTVKGANIILKVQAPSKAEIKDIPAGSLLIGMLAPYTDESLLKELIKTKIDSFSMEFVPRISRAQSMDVLSSQSNLSGYKSVLDAAEHYAHAFPMMMTAAGTIPPAKVFVMGAGVAGLQAIATARRLGAVVSATDVRAAAKEQVQSLGASFIAVEDDEFKEAETAGGYAKEMSASYKKKQAELVASHIRKQDIVITTALIPGRPAPKLVSSDMVQSMKHGSVIVDLAVETGGNCDLSKAGEVIEENGVKIIGHINVPSRLAADASALYAKNLFNFLTLIIDKETKERAIDWDDDIIKGICMTHNGKIVHPNFVPAVKTPAKTAVKKSTVKKVTQKEKATPAKKANTATKKKTASPAKKKTTKKDS